MPVGRPHRDTGNTETPAAMFAGSDVQSANQRPMYCKDKVYTGGKEFSLEELRSWHWSAKRRETQQRQALCNDIVCVRVIVPKFKILTLQARKINQIRGLIYKTS